MFKEYFGNMWDLMPMADAICITTNGFVKKNGEAVMGRGCAKQAAFMHPDLPRRLGAILKENGNHTQLLKHDRGGAALVSLPVKHHWFERADIRLIERSLAELNELAYEYDWDQIVVPRPGCGNGQLSWSKHVQRLCEKHLDGRYTVVDYG